ncbi:hypothetical protein NE261_05460 [Enterococcus italicus]|uniref:ArpU family phage packaging/lysis transcriptional regulator n=1 Tax=Enterococcus italicus TaxID=246144 RepID=UPI002072A710|nr:ArpU family phage packaging/lysis transcriptional regulator [Enterococcus italicus]MCM6931257.1 hypothetical protein [Enterococcus italicus]
MALLPKINEKKTRENVRDLLSDYATMKRSSAFTDSYRDLTKAIQYSDMPKSQSNRNSQEDKMIAIFKQVSKATITRSEECRYTVYAIDYAIEFLPPVSQEVLRLSYCMDRKYTINDIAARIKTYRTNEFGEVEEIQYSIKNIERLKNIALIQFAETYKGGKLLVEE